MVSTPIVNIAAYKFVALDRLAERRAALKNLCRKHGLKGTILLSPEGINLFVAGSRESVDRVLGFIRNSPELADIQVKKSLSQQQPFRRMLVKLKREIIAFGQSDIDPSRQTSQKLDPQILREWLDSGKPVTLLDVRNYYEIQLGTFRNAHSLGLDHFRHFPEAVEQLPIRLREQPVVMFCTGGIRCEKAGPFLEKQGFRNVFQLDGGILKYFEKCGGQHYEGDCFVFDQRVALNSELSETGTTQCFACQATVSEAEQRSEKYVVGKSCPHCYHTDDQSRRETLERRNATIRSVTEPLPGSVPYENRRPIHVPGRFDGNTLIDFLVALYPFVGRKAWEEQILNGQLRLDDRPVEASQFVTAGQRFEKIFPETIEPDVCANISVIAEDDWLVAVDKPAPLPVHPCGRFNRNTLISILQKIYRPQRLRLAHRLDANTSGVVLFSRTRSVARVIQPQFERGEVMKRYLARIIGRPAATHFRCDAPISSQPQMAGARTICKNGLPATTEFELLEHFHDGTSLVEARPKSGRTNQIRLHLWHLGFPIQGDPMYGIDSKISPQQTVGVNDPPLCLHARDLRIRHPHSNDEVVYQVKAPRWSFEE